MTIGAVRTIPGKFRGMSLCLLVICVGLEAGWCTDWIRMQLPAAMMSGGGVVRHDALDQIDCLCWYKKHYLSDIAMVVFYSLQNVMTRKRASFGL